MAVYVDAGKNPFGRMVMCHMLADSLLELHEMADKLGLKRSWFQQTSTPHYDVCQSKRKAAVALGAKEIDRNQVVALIRYWREQKTKISESYTAAK